MVSLFTTLSLALGLLIYLPLHRLNKKVQRLIDAQQRFGKGDLTSRADSHDISPIKEMTQSFNDMAEEIETRVKQSQLFSHAIPHEIRTPLSKIQMASDLAKRDDCQNRTYLLAKIDDHVEEISDLTRDILQLSNLTGQVGGKEYPESQNIHLKAFCHWRFNMMASCQTEFVTDNDIEEDLIFASQTLAKLVIDNLIKNADRYGNGYVELTLRQYPSCWTIDIEDNGNGIPKDKRKEVFMAFSRLDTSRSRHSGGFGLGLAIAQNAAKNLGWSISVDDSRLGGARFTVVIPSLNISDLL
jgi:signal transduction histidine kinase